MLGKMNPFFHKNMFQMGWFNHQLGDSDLFGGIYYITQNVWEKAELGDMMYVS